MKLLDEFFRVMASQISDTAATYTVTLNPDHYIFKAHFPGNPITPGVCQMRMIEELMSSMKGEPLRVSHINNIKYMNIISPIDNATIDIQLSRIQATDSGYSVHCMLKGGDVSFTKMNLVLSSKQ